MFCIHWVFIYVIEVVIFVRRTKPDSTSHTWHTLTKRLSYNAGLMLSQRCKQWNSIITTLGICLLLDGLRLQREIIKKTQLKIKNNNKEIQYVLHLFFIQCFSHHCQYDNAHRTHLNRWLQYTCTITLSVIHQTNNDESSRQQGSLLPRTSRAASLAWEDEMTVPCT